MRRDRHQSPPDGPPGQFLGVLDVAGHVPRVRAAHVAQFFFHWCYLLHIFGPRKIASMDGKGAGSFPPPNFKRPFMKRTSARFMMKS